MDKDRKRIALWGFGAFGRYFLGEIRTKWPDEVEVPCIFDMAFDRIDPPEDPPIPVMDPAEIPRLFQQGLFDGVMICIHDEQTAQEAARELAFRGVPVTAPDNLDSFLPARELRHAPGTFLHPDREGYELHVLDGMYMCKPQIDWKSYVYDEDGHIVLDLWHEYQFREVPNARAFRPGPAEYADPVEYPGDTFLLDRPYSGNYWHFLFENLDRAWVLEQAGYTGRYVLPPVPFAAEFMRLIGVTPERLTDSEVMYRSPRPWHFERLFIVTTEEEIMCGCLRDMAAQIRASLADGSCTGHTDFPRRVYVRRIGTRRLRSVKAVLDRYGFSEFIPEEHTTEEQVRCFMNADIVVSPHGANSANAIFMRPGTALIETFPSDYITMMNVSTCIACGIHYQSCVEENWDWHVPRVPDRGRDYSVFPPLREAAIRNAIVMTRDL